MTKFKFVSLSILTLSLAVAACSQQVYFNAYEYDHKYDNLEAKELEGIYSKHTYYDYGVKSLYSYYGYDTAYSPSIGNAKYLVIPVWFTDSTNYIDIDYRNNIKDDIETAYFGSEEETGWESVKTYYEKDSFGRLSIDGFVTDWYECGKSTSSFRSSNSSYNTIKLVVDATDWAKEKYGNLSEYDCNSDGYIDGVILIYAALEQVGAYYTGETGDNGNLWAYTSYLMDPSLKDINNPGPNTFFWASYDFMYGREMAKSRTNKSSWGYGDTKYCEIDSHTFIHEAGHLFGLPDYYDYGENGESPALGFSMQDHNVGAHDPFSRFSLGWAKAIVPKETTKITLKPIEESGEFIILSSNFSGTAFDEYIAIELYTPTGLNAFDTANAYQGGGLIGPNKAGVRLWHIDSRLFNVTKFNTLTGEVKAGEIITEFPAKSRLMPATSNSSGSRAVDYGGSDKYRQLKVIRRDYFRKPSEDGDVVPSVRYPVLSEDDLFVTGDYFTTEQYRSQFVNRTKLNNEKELGWAIYFDEVSENSLTVTCIKR